MLGTGTWTWRPQAGGPVWSAGVHALLQQPEDQPANWELWLSSVHPDDKAMVRRSLLDAPHEVAQPRPLTYRLSRRDGSIIWIEDRRCWHGGDVCAGIFIDVTQTAQSRQHDIDAERRAQRVMEAAGIGIFFRDFESGEDYWNDTLFAICGLSASARPPACDQLLPVIHPKDRDMVRRHVDRCRALGEALDLEYRIVTPGGEQRWVRERGRYLKSAEGALLRYYGAITDVTAERQRTEELESSRRFLQLALKSNAMGAWEWNRAADRHTWSDEMKRIMGFEPGEFSPTQENWLSVLHPDDRDWATELWGADTQSEVHAITYRIIVAGKVRWIRESWKDFPDEDGSQIRIGVSADVTDWKEREHRQSITDKWLTLAVDGGRIGLWSHDGLTKAYHWNDHMFTLLGYAPGEIEPSVDAWYSRIHPDDRDRVIAAVYGGLSGPGEVVIEYRVLLPGNVERWLEERGSAAAGGSSVHHGVLFDITARKSLQQHIENSRQRLQMALDTGKMGFWMGQGDEEEWDERTYDILGFAPHAVPANAESFYQIVHPEDLAYVSATDQTAARSGDTIMQEFRIVRPDGAVRWIELASKVHTRRQA